MADETRKGRLRELAEAWLKAAAGDSDHAAWRQTPHPALDGAGIPHGSCFNSTDCDVFLWLSEYHAVRTEKVWGTEAALPGLPLLSNVPLPANWAFPSPAGLSREPVTSP